MMPVTLVFQHVKGHQDTGQITALPRLAWMNIQMDSKAKERLLTTTSQPKARNIPYEGWICLIEGQQVIKDLTENLRHHLNGKIILNHWITTQSFTAESAGSIDWDMAATATRRLPKFKQLWVSKLATKFLPYGKNMRRWNVCQQARCPHCSCPVEDKEHIFKCQEASAVKQWNKALDDLDHWLQSQHSHPQIWQDIIHGL